MPAIEHRPDGSIYACALKGTPTKPAGACREQQPRHQPTGSLSPQRQNKPFYAEPGCSPRLSPQPVVPASSSPRTGRHLRCRRIARSRPHPGRLAAVRSPPLRQAAAPGAKLYQIDIGVSEFADRPEERQVRALDRRQHREPLSWRAQIQRIGTRGFFRNSLNPRRCRAAAARCNHGRDDIRRPRKQRLHAAVAAVAHPAFKAARGRPLREPVAVADALHPAPDRHPDDRLADFHKQCGFLLSVDGLFARPDGQRSSDSMRMRCAISSRT
jgi:hypothetical protein